MFRFITVALVCAAAWSLVQAAMAEPAPGTRLRGITLEEAIARALDASPGLRAKEELVAGADAQVRQSGVWPNPTVEAELENFGGSGRFSDLDESELTLAVTQRIERGGKRAGRSSVAEADRDAAALERERTRFGVIFDARKAFVELFAAQAALDNAKVRLKAASEIEAMAARRVNAARDPVTVKFRTELQTAEARTARDQAERDLHNAKRTMALLWGGPDTEFAIDATSLKVPPDAKGQPTQTSPDIEARQIAVRRAEARLQLEQANARSDVSVGVGVRRFENGGDLAGVLTVSMPLAIFDSNAGNIDRAVAEQRAAELDVADIKQRHLAAIVRLEEEVARSRAELDAVRNELLPRAKSALAAARRGYDAGAFSYQEVAEAQRVLNELMGREVAALRTLHIAHADLDRTNGRLSGAPSHQGTKQ